MSYLVLILVLLFATKCEVSGALTLYCTFGIYEYRNVGSIYECVAKIVFVGETDEKVASVSGSHLDGMKNVDVQGLDVSFNMNSLTYISNYHLNPFPKLEYIDLRGNKLSSLDSNVFYGLTSLKRIDLRHNNIEHVGPEFILPQSGEIKFNSNVCIDKDASTVDQINSLKFSLSVNCPPTISQIETILESRSNYIAKVNSEIQNIVRMNVEMNDEIKRQSNELSLLKYINFQLVNRMKKLEAAIESRLGLKIED